VAGKPKANRKKNHQHTPAICDSFHRYTLQGKGVQTVKR
jgi:hypothetical protein